MYTLLIADDERAIREGIYKSVCWQDIGIEKVFLAKNGQEAYDTILLEQPDIVLTDIIMPELTGIELIEKAKEKLPKTQFIILTGHNDFCYAQKAIHYGVKQYLLKPCDGNSIRKIMEESVSYIKAIEEEDAFIHSLKDNVEKLLPQAKEQYFRDCIEGFPHTGSIDVYKDLFDLPEGLCRILLFKVGEQDYVKLLTVKKLIEKSLGAHNVCFCIAINTNVIVMTSMIDFSDLTSKVKKIQYHCSSGLHIDVTVAISSEGFFKSTSRMYRETKDIIQYEFYLGEGKIITKSDVDMLKTDHAPQAELQTVELSAAIRSGNVIVAKHILNSMFHAFQINGFDVNRVKAPGIELYMNMIRQCEDDEIGYWIKNITKISQCSTLSDIHQFLLKAAVMLAKNRYEHVIASQNKVIEKVIRYVHDNIDNENLSLQLIATNILYLNVDYLGKLFKKEVGMRFSQYLLKARMEKAKELMSQDMKIYEIAKATGFSNNPSYFSQIFKKYTGYVPKDFRQGETGT